MSQSALKVAESRPSEKSIRPFGMKDKVGYLFGDFGNDFFFILVMMFLMVFYTDVLHINPAQSVSLFIVARLVGCICRCNVGPLH